MFNIIFKIQSTLLWSTTYLVLKFHDNIPLTFLQLKPNSITLAGSELVWSWFELKFGLSSSLLAAN